MLTDLWAIPGSYSVPTDQANGRWITNIVYDPVALRPQATYSPAAITMPSSSGSTPAYDRTFANLNVQRNSANCLIEVNSYLTVTAGGFNFSYLDTTSVQSGTGGSLIPTRSFTYTTHAGSICLDHLAGVVKRLPQLSHQHRAEYDQLQLHVLFHHGPGSNAFDAAAGHPQFRSRIRTATISSTRSTRSSTSRGGPASSSIPMMSPVPPSYKPSTQFFYDEPTGAMIQSVRNPSTSPPDTCPVQHHH